MALPVVLVPLIAAPLVLLGLAEQDFQTLLIPVPPVLAGLVALSIAAISKGGSAGTLFGRGRPRFTLLALAVGVGVGAFLLFNVGLGALVSVVLDLLNFEAPEVQQSLRDAATRPEALPVLVVSTVVLAPLGEEMLYRGLLFQSLLRRFRPAVAITLSALAFGVGHFTVGGAGLSNVVLVVLIVPLGMVLAWSFLRWQTLWVPIVIHACFNAVTVALMVSGLA